jgi:hypothetical protein
LFPPMGLDLKLTALLISPHVAFGQRRERPTATIGGSG